MSQLDFSHYWFAFPLFFATLWLVVTTVLSLLTGWFELMRAFPNRYETALYQLNNRSGSMSWVHLNGILKLAVCPSGLRIGIWRIFGPFCKDIFIPWSQLKVFRHNRILWQTAELQLGHPRMGKLKINGYVADRLARHAQGLWPETGSFARKPFGQIFGLIFLQWLAVSLIAAAYFYIVISNITGLNHSVLKFIIGFPFIAFGISFIVRLVDQLLEK